MKFIVAWALLLLAKLWLALALPAFGDEAFYALESRRLAWAYSDLPGLSAWLVRAGTEAGGPHLLAVRLPFLLLGASLPWLVVRIARRWAGEAAGWQAGLLSLLMPLAGLMGVLALPDVPMLFAALLCLDAFAQMLEKPRPAAWAQLALALAIGALSHYRFVLVLVAGAAGLLCDPRGRALLRRPALWVVLAIGALAWLPLVAWNLGHAGAGLAFQFVDRHPWGRLQVEGAWWPLVQALVVTPGLFVLLVATLWVAWRRRGDGGHWPLVLGVGAVSVPGYFVMAFFADSERISFHWPLAGWLVLVCAAPAVLARSRRGARVAVYALAGLGLVAMLGYFVVVANADGRAWLARGPAYADNFSGWNEVADAVHAELATLPAGTRVVADNFMLGSQLALALDRGDIAVLEHPLNAKHGRAVQLADWGLVSAGRDDWGDTPVLLVVEDTARPLKMRLQGYRQLCRRTGGLPPARVLNVDHGRKRFLLFRLPAATPACAVPALAWLELPAPGAIAAGTVSVRGWALAEGDAVASIDVLVDGDIRASVSPTLQRPDVLAYWGIASAASTVGFAADVDVSGLPRGPAWLGLRLHLRDGRVEDWPSQPIVLE